MPGDTPVPVRLQRVKRYVHTVQTRRRKIVGAFGKKRPVGRCRDIFHARKLAYDLCKIAAEERLASCELDSAHAMFTRSTHKRCDRLPADLTLRTREGAR